MERLLLARIFCPSSTHRKIFLNQPEIRLHFSFSGWFGTKRMSVWIQIYREMVNTIWFQVDLIRLRKNFSVYWLEFSAVLAAHASRYNRAHLSPTLAPLYARKCSLISGGSTRNPVMSESPSLSDGCTLRKLYFQFLSNWMGYGCDDSFPFNFEPNGILFGSKSKLKLSSPSIWKGMEV